MTRRVRALMLALRFLPYDLRHDRRLEVGPLVITTRGKRAHERRVMFELGRDVGAVDGPAPRPRTKGGLRVVS